LLSRKNPAIYPMDDKAVILSRQRHYFYVLIFSVALWILLASLAAIFFPFFTVRGICSCGIICDYSDSSFPLYAFIGVIIGFVFSLVFNRWMHVAYSQKSAMEIQQTWMAGIGRKLFGWRGLVFLIALIAAYIFSCRLISRYNCMIINSRIPGLCADKHVAVRINTSRTLWIRFEQRKDPEYLEPLVRVLREEKNVRVKQYVTDALGELADIRAFWSLLEEWKKSTKKSKRKALPCSVVRYDSALANFRNSVCVKALCNMLLNSTSFEVRYTIPSILSEIGDKSAVEPLAIALEKDNDSNVRWGIIYALSALNDERAVVPLIRTLSRDPDTNIRGEAVDALRKFTGPAVITALEKASKADGDAEVRKRAKDALYDLRSQKKKNIDQ